MPTSEHKAIESLALTALQSLGDLRSDSIDRALEYHATHSDYYTLLGIERDSDVAMIRASIQALREHPDTSFSLRAALHNAEVVLMDPVLRARYNATL